MTAKKVAIKNTPRKKEEVEPPHLLHVNIMQPVFLNEQTHLPSTKSTQVVKKNVLDYEEFVKEEGAIVENLSEEDEEESESVLIDKPTRTYKLHGVITVLRKRIANAIINDDTCFRSYQGYLGTSSTSFS